jgi:hypothetical protein
MQEREGSGWRFCGKQHGRSRVVQVVFIAVRSARLAMPSPFKGSVLLKVNLAFAHQGDELNSSTTQIA